MKTSKYFQPTEIRFGRGRLDAVGEAIAQFGKRCLIVTGSVFPAIDSVFDRVKSSLQEVGVEWVHFDGVIPNPTTDCVTEGANMAKKFGADVILGVGGGSSMDTAKAIAVEATHPGTA